MTRHNPEEQIVAQGMRMHWLADPGSARRLAAGMPDYLVGDGIVRTFGLQTGKHPTVAPRQRAVVSAQLLAQLGTEGSFAGLAAFAVRDANDHALFVDVLGTALRLGTADAESILQRFIENRGPSLHSNILTIREHSRSYYE